jgi:purine-binding chemotaxis protein CheW
MEPNASVSRDGTAPEEPSQYLTFRLMEQTFAMSVLTIKEIIELDTLTVVPMMPACVRGVINLRGKVVPVIDLALRFGGAATLPSRRTCIIIVELGTALAARCLGVLVDAVHQVVELPPRDIEAAPSIGTQLRPDFIVGLGKSNEGIVIILDLDRVLSEDELAGFAGAGASDDVA